MRELFPPVQRLLSLVLISSGGVFAQVVEQPAGGPVLLHIETMPVEILPAIYSDRAPARQRHVGSALRPWPPPWSAGVGR